MSSDTQNPSEISENKNDIPTNGPPPELDITLPTTRDIGKVRGDPQVVERESVDLLLVTVKDHEFLSCYFYLEDVKRYATSGPQSIGMVDIGHFGESGGGKVKVALIRCGMNASTITVKNAVELLGPRAVVCVGFCGIINREKAKLGDVVISAKLGTYAPKKRTADGEEWRGIKGNVSRNMAELIKSAEDGWDPPPFKEPVPTDFKVKVHRSALMLSGPELVDNLERRQKLLKQFPEAIALEMEGEGLYQAAYDLEMEWVVVKGISDLADGKKKETGNWQPFASIMAASIVHNMFKYPDVIQGWPHYQKRSQGSTTTAVTPAESKSPPTPSLPVDRFL